MTFKTIDLLLFPALAQGLILAIVLWRKNTVPNHSRKALAVVLAFSSSLLFGRVILTRMAMESYPAWCMIIDSTIFLFGPLWYRFIKQVISKSKYKMPWWHLIPFLAHLTIVLAFSTVWNNYFQQISGTMTIWYWYGTLEGLGLVFNAIYSVLGISLLYRTWADRESLWATNPIGLRVPLLVAGMVGLGVMFWAINFISGWVFDYWMSAFSYNSMWLSLASVTYLVGYSMWARPDRYRVLAQPLLEKLPKEAPRLTGSESTGLADQLNQLMSEQRIYEQGDISLQQLADELATSTQNLSWLLNNHFQLSFYEYINRLRLRAFIDKVEKGEHETKKLLALAMEVGFNSKSTFNRVFKETYQCTPTQYINQSGKSLMQVQSA